MARSTAPSGCRNWPGVKSDCFGAMPLIPMYFDVWAYLRKPYVRGLASNLFDTRSFKYAWIERNWKTA